MERYEVFCLLLAFSSTVHLASCLENITFTANDTRVFTERYADYVNANDLRDPLSGNSRECTPGRRTAPTYVCDASALLPTRSVHRIDSEIQRLYDARSSKYAKAICRGVRMEKGYLFEVVLVRRLSSGPNGARYFADSLFRRWIVSSSEVCGNGILLLISLEDRKYYFSVGENVRSIMDRTRVNRVERVLIRYLKAHNLYLAVLNTVIKTGEELRSATFENDHGNGYSAPNSRPAPNETGSNTKEHRSPWSFVLTVIGLISSIALLLACCNGGGGKEAAIRKRRMREVSAKLETIKREYESSSLESRDEELTSQVNELANEYPDIITEQVKKKLLDSSTSPPNYGGTPAPPSDGSSSRTSGPAWQSLAGAAGISALAGWGINSLLQNNDDDDRNRYSSGNNWGFGGAGEDWTGGWGGNDETSGSFFGGTSSGGWGGSNSGWGGNTSSGWGTNSGGGGNWGGSGGGGGNSSGFGGSW